MIPLVFVVVLLSGIRPATAQPDKSPPPDSMLAYDLAEIVVSDGSVFEAEANTVNRVSIADIAGQNAISVADVARVIPAAHVQTNSRGESLIYLRNAGERQVALFFNGALLNIPWDNRINLDLIPSSVIGGMTVSKGVPSVHYGTNAVGGAINMRSRAIDSEGSVTEVEGRAGTHGAWNGTVTHIFSHRGFQATGSLGYSTRNGMPMPGGVDLAFSQPDSDLRTNTDRSMLNGFVQGAYRFSGGAELGLSYLGVDGNFGIAPEGHLDPQVSRVRFWRYPDWKNSLLILNGDIPLGSSGHMNGAVWGNWFDQTIDSFGSLSYDDLEERQKDRDRAVGSRVVWYQQVGVGQFSLSGNVLFSRHEELVLGVDDAGRPVEMPGLAPESYSQFVFSSGLEYSLPVSPAVRVNAGASIDGITTPETGDKPALVPLTDYGVSAGLQVRLRENLLLRAAAGRKVRFPTLRELFGVALNRFLLNPDLQPESAFVYEAALATQGANLSGEVIAFFHRTFDTIDQQNVEVDGRTLRQRINLEGSRVWGVELVGRARPLPGVSVDGHFTWMRPRAFGDEGTVPLTEKPALLSSLGITHRHRSGLSISASGVWTGKAYGLTESNDIDVLPASYELHVKGAYRFQVQNLYNEVFFRVDNVFDVTTLPQLGLPARGRFVSAGLNVSF